MERDISPPPTKRRRISNGSDVKVAKSKSKETDQPNPDTSQSLRIFTWNINGIIPFLQTPITKFFSPSTSSTTTASKAPASLRTFLHRHHFPQLLFLQEVKIPASDLKTQRAVTAAVDDRLDADDEEHGPEYVVHFTLPRDKFNAKGFGGRVYGVASIIRKDFYDQHVTSVRDVEWDLEGRVSVVELKGKLAIWNIYAVNGTDAPYRDPQTGQAKGTRHDRKLAFHRLLVDECKKMEGDGWTHVLAGDFNVAPARIDGHPNLRTWPAQHVVNRADFNSRFLDGRNGVGLRAVDVWRALKKDERKYTYYPRGREWGSSCDRVDLILASRKLWEDGDVLDAGILDSPQERGPSDHVPLWVRVRYECEKEIQDRDREENEGKRTES
ncbi:DNase I-like protein [Rhizodiscina lignyota]|uniref:DNase I-like protein n=1 Tax=Rhizodiscina lignyota TaxID=1504668 RepID=A0A9P4MDT5_9PEZI|nr:DNase I-like protein [Rhizodiscina lignyota]